MYEYRSSSRPPITRLPVDTKFIDGVTHYDWDRRAMTEIYHERCIDIFSAGRDFSCQFLSKKNKTYFIKNLGEEKESCCRWSAGDFWAPRPDVLSTMKFDEHSNLRGRDVFWSWLDIGLPGPFGYGLFNASKEPAAFWFPVIGGLVQQEFYHFRTSDIDRDLFSLPLSCKSNISICVR